MANDVYQRLAQYLDDLPAGFPPTESGVELRILQRLFTPEDAALVLHLTLIPEEPRVIARRAKIPVEEAERRLEVMDQKGVISGIHRPGQPPRYQVMQFLVGFWEGQVNRLDRELAEDFEAYLPTFVEHTPWQEAPQLRTIPVEKSIPVQWDVMPYEQAEALLGNHNTFAVNNCICRQEHQLLDDGCDKPMETCLTMGGAAKHGIQAWGARPISREEALVLLEQAEEAGLVLQPANNQRPNFICMCCGCCCAVLRGIKMFPKPASVVSSHYVASLDVDLCDGCGMCETRCQMEAVYLTNGTAELDLERCIGCGLCVTTCPNEALTLHRKPEAELPTVPKNVVESYIKLGQARGRYGMGELLGIAARSKVDRVLARIGQR
jgi:ferredoxin